MPPSDSVERLCARVIAGDVRALARACRLVDERARGHRDLLRALFPHSAGAFVVGITGSPGAGKSTLTDRLVAECRADGERVAVLAVDPTSPFSGGAILGDRIRMQRHFEDPEVFIRSVATRGALGGLSRSAADLMCVLGAWQPAVVFVETVGVGQDELDIARLAHSTLVVLAPGLGDDIQAVKAGILECADVFAVNKADRDGADATVADIAQMVALGAELAAQSRHHGVAAAQVRAAVAAPVTGEAYRPPILKCVAARGEGVRELRAALLAHRQWLETTEAGAARKRARAHEQLVHTLRDALSERAFDSLGPAISAAAARVERHELDPYSACDELIQEFSRSRSGA